MLSSVLFMFPAGTVAQGAVDINSPQDADDGLGLTSIDDLVGFYAEASDVSCGVPVVEISGSRVSYLRDEKAEIVLSDFDLRQSADGETWALATIEPSRLTKNKFLAFVPIAFSRSGQRPQELALLAVQHLEAENLGEDHEPFSEANPYRVKIRYVLRRCSGQAVTTGGAD